MKIEKREGKLERKWGWGKTMGVGENKGGGRFSESTLKLNLRVERDKNSIVALRVKLV